MRPTAEFWRLLGVALIVFAFLAGLALLAASAGAAR